MNLPSGCAGVPHARLKIVHQLTVMGLTPPPPDSREISIQVGVFYIPSSRRNNNTAVCFPLFAMVLVSPRTHIIVRWFGQFQTEYSNITQTDVGRVSWIAAA